jgi:hypothetical protein
MPSGRKACASLRITLSPTRIIHSALLRTNFNLARFHQTKNALGGRCSVQPQLATVPTLEHDKVEEGHMLTDWLIASHEMAKTLCLTSTTVSV